jgi:hypothetical protein
MRSRQRRAVDNNSARCASRKIVRKEEQQTRTKHSEAGGALFPSPKRQNEYQGYRSVPPDQPRFAMPVLIGASIIAAAILLSTLVTAVGTRFVGMESSADQNLWLVDRLTGSVYKCQAVERGRASCDPEIATGSIGERGRR